MPRGFLIVAGLAASCFVSDANGIVRRHDVDDARYVELASDIESVFRVGGACGTLVGERWILTAAHVADGVGPMNRTVEIAGEEFQIDKVFFHPAWEGEPSETSVDMALVRISAPVTAVEPEALYTWQDELGQEVLFVGPGMYGTGEVGPTGEDGALRGATNTVANVLSDGWINFQFDSPAEATECEGISGPGDSGGPAFIERDGRRYVAGVSSSNDDHGLGHCRYNTTEYYARVAPSAQWLHETMRSGLEAPADAFPEVQFVDDAALPSTPAGKAAAAFFAVYDADQAARIAFEQTWRAESALARRSAEARAAGWPDIRNQLGAQSPVAFIDLGPAELEVVTFDEATGDWRSFLFQCEDEAPNKLLVIQIADTRPLNR